MNSDSLLGPTTALATKRLRLEPLSLADAADLAAAMANPSIFRYIGGKPPPQGEMEARIRRYHEGPARSGEAWHNWAIRLRDGEAGEGRLIGHLQATVRDGGGSVQVAWLVGVPWQGRGYATEAAEALLDWLKSSGTNRVIAHIAPGNVGSEKVADRIGLRATDAVEDGESVWRRELAGPPTG